MQIVHACFFMLSSARHLLAPASYSLFSHEWHRSENIYLLFSLWHLAKALQRLGSGHRSRGDWPFLLRMVKSAPLAARKQAMDAALFFSAPWVPKPMINCREQEGSRKTHKLRDAPGFFLTWQIILKLNLGKGEVCDVPLPHTQWNLNQ